MGLGSPGENLAGGVILVVLIILAIGKLKSILSIGSKK